MISRTILIALPTLLAACMPLSDTSADRQRGTALKVATWNLEHLAQRNGTGCRPRDDADYALLRQHAEQLDADVIALQEVESTKAAERVFDPARYDVIMSRRPDSGRGGGCLGKPGLTIRHQGVGFWTRRSAQMRRAIIYPAACIVLYGAVAWIFALPPFQPSPTFYGSVPTGGKRYICNGGIGPSIFIRFKEDGNVAIVRAGSYTLRLPYRTTDMMNDVYKSGPWRLTLDPEANLTGPRSLRFGNCY